MRVAMGRAIRDSGARALTLVLVSVAAVSSMARVGAATALDSDDCERSTSAAQPQAAAPGEYIVRWSGFLSNGDLQLIRAAVSEFASVERLPSPRRDLLLIRLAPNHQLPSDIRAGTRPFSGVEGSVVSVDPNHLLQTDERRPTDPFYRQGHE